MAIVPTIGGRQCLHPGEAFRAAQDNATPFDFWQRANSYTCPLGAEPGVAWLLMLRADLEALDRNTLHELKWIDGVGKDAREFTVLLMIVKSSVMNLALATVDKKAAMLVEFQDKRRELKKFSSINDQFNVRIPAPSTTSGAGLYYTDSLDGGSVFTWQTMLDTIWQTLPGDHSPPFGPTLPYTPDGTPEGWRFIGRNGWEALHEVLAKINCTTAYDPILDTYSYVLLVRTAGAASPFANLPSQDRLMYDYDPGLGYQRANMPETVRVFFQRRELYHGIETDTVDTLNWEMEPVVSKDRLTGSAGVTVGTVLNVWDDLPAEFDDAGNSNSPALQTRANEIGDNIRDRIGLISDGRFRQMYSGITTEILPDGEFTEVIWRDYGDETGLVTELIRKPLEEWRNDKHVGETSRDKLRPPDLDRATHPLWPRVSQPVRVDDGSSSGSTGVVLSPNSDGLFPGFVRRWSNGGFIDLDACWIRPVDLQGDRENKVGNLRQLDTLIGRLSGVETSESSTRPVYLCREGSGTSGKGAPIRAVWGSTLAPIEVAGTPPLWYIDRNGVADTDWALMDGISNSIARGGSGQVMWDRGTGDTFFARARGSNSDSDNINGARTVPFADPNQDIIQLNDHNDHTHEVLELCEILYQAPTGGDPDLFGWDAPGIRCVSTVRGALGCAETEVPGVLEHTFVNGQGPDLNDPIDFNVAPPNKDWHWFERVAETGADAVAVPSLPLFIPPQQPMPILPVQPVAAGALFREDNGDPLPS